MNHPSNKITSDNLRDAVYSHTLTDPQQVRAANIAQACEAFMRAILTHAPDCADRSTALRDARAAKMWAISAVALEPRTVTAADLTP